MPAAELILQQLARSTHPVADHVLAAALPTSAPTNQARLARCLLKRSRSAGLTSLLKCFHVLDKELQSSIVRDARQGLLDRAMREALAEADQDDATPLARAREGMTFNAIQLAGRAEVFRLAHDLIAALRRGSTRQRHAAAELLKTWATRTGQDTDLPVQNATQPGAFELTPKDRHAIQRAVVEAVALYPQHRRDDVIDAWLMLGLAVPDGMLYRLRDTGSAALTQVADRLRSPTLDDEQQAVLPGLTLDLQVIQDAALTGLAECVRNQSVSELLKHSHLLALPRVRKLLRSQHRLRDTLLAEPVPRILARRSAPSPASTTPRLPATCATLFEALPLTDVQRVEVIFAHLAQLETANPPADPRQRLSWLRALGRCARRLRQSKDAPPLQAVRDALLHEARGEDVPCARLASHLLARLGATRRPDVSRHLLQSPHAAVRETAARRLSRSTFTRLWAAWDRMDGPQRFAAGRTLMRMDPRFHDTLRRKLRLGDTPQRLRGLAIVADLNQGPLFADLCLRYARQGNDRLLASAVRALAGTTTQAGVSQIRQALSHDDPRVRANAAAAIRTTPRGFSAADLAPLLSDARSRPRADAIYTLLIRHWSDPHAELEAMLTDSRPDHRRSAAWLIGHARLAEYAARLAEIAVSDPDPMVRKQAHDATDHFIAELSVADAPPLTASAA